MAFKWASALIAAGMLLCGAAGSALAFEVAGTTPLISGLTVHPADEVLERYCVQEGDRWILRLPGGLAFELISDIMDPAIVNKGDGSFHPMPSAQVRDALESVDFPLGSISAEIFILPYPRRSGLESAAGPGLILLSPGVREVPREQIHAEVAHELGHVVHHALMPDADLEAWERYRTLRGISDESLYNAWATHANRPHEIFAEDFRGLFGGALANYSGTLENGALAPPATVSGLREFIRQLDGGTGAAPLSFAFPNPTRAGARFVLPAAGAESLLDLFDAAGRRVASLTPTSRQGATVVFDWDGRNSDGRAGAPGAYLARLRGASRAAVRVILLPGR